MTRAERRKARQKAQRRRVLRLIVCAVVFCVVFVMVAATTAGGNEAKGTKYTATPTIDPVQMAAILTMYAPNDDYIAEPTPTKAPQPVLWTEEEVEAVAKTVWGEAVITGSDLEMSAVAWCILNRVDSGAYADSIMEVVTQYRQFHGYDEDNPVDEHIKGLVLDVFSRWAAEKQGQEDVGRTLPAEYLFFWGDGLHNHFTTEYQGGKEWDWSLPNPYET